jgi:hypothetical protein
VKLLQLHQHRQGALNLAVKERFVTGQLFQPARLQAFAQGLRLDGRLVPVYMMYLSACRCSRYAWPSWRSSSRVPPL